MKKLLYKTSLFIVAFFLFFLLSFKYYTSEKGDLLRIGYIGDIQNYNSKEVFRNEMDRKINYTLFSQINLKKKNRFNVFTIGDSFSEQEMISYQNYLADDSAIKVLHYDRFLHDNPLETLTGFLNGDILDSLKVDFIILQSVERQFVDRGIDFNKNIRIDNDSKQIINRIGQRKNKEIVDEKTKDKFFRKATLLFPINAILYNFDDNAYSSKVYQVRTKENLFSTNDQGLMFLNDDYDILKINNDLNNIKTLNNELNKLSVRLKQRGMKLIVLPSPDKFDFYYDDIVNKSRYAKPLFFESMRSLDKNYIYIDSKKLLKEKTSGIKDVYFYDDTHWSPIATKIIADKIKAEIKISE